MCVTICGKFCPDEGAVAGGLRQTNSDEIYRKVGRADRGNAFPTYSVEKRYKSTKNVKKHTRHKRSML